MNILRLNTDLSWQPVLCFYVKLRGSKKTLLNQIQPLSTSPSFLHSPRVPAGVTYCRQFLNIFLRSPEWSQTEVLQQIINKLLPEHNSATWGGETNDLWVKLSPVKTERTCGWPASGRDPAARGRSHCGEKRGRKGSTWRTSDPNWRKNNNPAQIF